MREELLQIGASTVDALLEIREEEAAVSELLARVEARHDKVSEPVYRRVRTDYESRLAALASRALPLAEQARSAFERLQGIHESVSTELANARFDREELAFRHDVGELTDQRFAEASREIDATLARCQEEFDESDRLRERLLRVIENPGPMTPTGAGAPDTPAPLAAAPAATTEVAIEPAEMPAEVAPEPAMPEVAEVPALADVSQTPEADEGAVFSAGQVETDTETFPSLPAQPSNEKTSLFLLARFVTRDDVGLDDSYAVSVRTTIGRDPDNEICIPSVEVSRKHAVVKLTEAGYLLTDLKSRNGTFVNDEKIMQRVLADGDEVRFGKIRFTFRRS